MFPSLVWVGLIRGRVFAASAQRALSDSRAAILALNGPVDEPLAAAVARTATALAERSGVRLDLDLDEEAGAAPRTRNELLRILGEAISNAIRHGDASKIRVALSAQGGLRLRISDDGCGFDQDLSTDAANGGFGLAGMWERVTGLGGALHVRSRPGEGTEVEVVLLNRAPRALIADQHPAMRSSVRRLLEREGFEVCGEASDGEAAVKAALSERPDICLIGVLMPENGIRTTRRIATALPETAVVILTGSESRDHLVGAIRAGAVGYLLKSASHEKLPSILRGVLAGEAAIPRKLVAPLVRELQSQGHRRAIVEERGRRDLTAREWEVMDLMCEGLDTAEIAERLFVSPVTVRRHASRILSKLGVEDRSEAVALLQGQV